MFSWTVLPDFAKTIRASHFNSAFELGEVLVQHLEGRPLTNQQVGDLTRRFNLGPGAFELFPGGKTTLFALKIPAADQKGTYFMIKPYVGLELTQLILHTVSVEDFNRDLGGKSFEEGTHSYLVRVLPVVGMGRFLLKGSHPTPVLLQIAATGGYLREARDAPKVSRICRQIAKEGYIIDPWESNWRYVPEKRTLEYLDLLYSNKASGVEQKMMHFLGRLADGSGGSSSSGD